MKSEIAMRKFVVDASKVKEVADFVRYQTQTVKQTALKELPDATEERTSLTVSSGRREWQKNDVEVIKNFFASYVTMPSKKEVLSLFRQDDVLKFLLEREGAQRCYEKVKNVFRTKAAK